MGLERRAIKAALADAFGETGLNRVGVVQDREPR
jgi:hypothetical protein